MSNKKAAARAKNDMSKWAWQWMMMKQYKVGYIMVAPFMIMFLIFTIIPMIGSFLVSFTSYNMIQAPKFIFMQNYVNLFVADDLFIVALRNTMMFAVIIGPGSFIISLIVAWFLNELSPRVRGVMTFVFYAPSYSGNANLIWTLLFSSDSYGYANGWLMEMGVIDEPILWFTNPTYVIPLVIIITLWSSLGAGFLSFVAGLQGVNRSLYEAGAIDGVTNRWQELWYITLPSIKQNMLFAAINSIIGAFAFSAEGLAGNPSTDYCAYTLQMHLGEYSGVRWEIGYASAIAIVLFLLTFGSNIFVNKLLSKVGR